MAVFCTDVLNIQDVNQPKKAREGPVACDFNEALIFSACSIGVKDGPTTIPPGVVKAKKIFMASLTLNGLFRRKKKKKKKERGFRGSTRQKCGRKALCVFSGKLCFPPGVRNMHATCERSYVTLVMFNSRLTLWKFSTPPGLDPGDVKLWGLYAPLDLRKKERCQRQQIFYTNRKCPADWEESGGKASNGPLRDHIVWVWAPQGWLYTSTSREGWENTGGDAEGGLLLGITSPMNIFSSLLDLLDRKKKYIYICHLHFLPPPWALSQSDDIWMWKSGMSGRYIWLPLGTI